LFKRVMQKLDEWLGDTGNFLILVSGLMIMTMSFAQTYGVIKRYVFHAPDPFAYELSTMFLLFCGVLAVAGVERLDRNVRNDIVSSRFPSLVKIIVINTLFPLLALAFCSVLTWKSLDNAIYALQIGQVTQSTWALPLAPIKLVIPFGYILLCLVLVSKIVKGISLMINPKKREQLTQSDTNNTE
jgi:TRAP-type mannitol/chloroaromatic compound transport system permease small subunit